MTDLEKIFDGIENYDPEEIMRRLSPWSHTKLGYSTCPEYVSKMFTLGRMRDFKGATLNNRGGEFLAAGIAAHELLENWLLYSMGKERLRHPGEVMSGLNILINDWPLLIEHNQKAKSIFRFNHDGTPDFPGGEIIGVEDEIHVDENWNYVDAENSVHGSIYQSSPSFFKGTIDMIQWDNEEKIITITDHKRQFNVLSETALSQHMQLMTYAALALAKYPDAHKVVMRMYFIRHGFWREVEKFPVELKHIPETIKQMAIANSVYLFNERLTQEPRPGKACDLCMFAMSCPIMDKEISVNGTIRDNSEAVAVISHLNYQKRVVSELQSLLKEYCAENGPVDSGGGKEYGFSPNKKKSWKIKNPKEFLDVSIRINEDDPHFFPYLNIKPEDFYAMNQKFLDKVMARLEKLGEKEGKWDEFKSFEEHTLPRVQTRFSNSIKQG